jgi:hypothetical protein
MERTERLEQGSFRLTTVGQNLPRIGSRDR